MPTPASESPEITILITAHNEAERVPASLQAISMQDYPMERVEIILTIGLAVIRSSGVKRGVQPVPQVFRVGVIDSYFENARRRSRLQLARIGRSAGALVVKDDPGTRMG